MIHDPQNPPQLPKEKLELEFVVERAYTPLSYSLTCFANAKKSFSRFLPVPVKDYTVCYHDFICIGKGNQKLIGDIQIERYKKEGGAFLQSMAQLCEREGERLLAAGRKNDEIDFEKWPNQELGKHMDAMTNAYRCFSVFLYYPLCISAFLDTEIDRIAKRCASVTDEDIMKMKARLSSPIKPNENQKESQSFARLVQRVQKNPDLVATFHENPNVVFTFLAEHHPDILQAINEHVQAYGWTQIRWLMGEAMDARQIVERLRDALESKTNAADAFVDYAAITQQANAIIQKAKLSAADTDMIWITKEYVFLRTYRSDVLNRFLYDLRPMLREAAKRLSLSWDDFQQLSAEEAIASLNNGVVLPSVNVEERKKSWALLRVGDEVSVFQGAQADQFAREQQILDVIPKVEQEVKGVVAVQGKVQGRAVIVNSPLDLPNVQKGDILVAVMTFPSYIVAMERAAAFVTDEGGILCHAAIIAREMKKPCIIATKTATKALKTGDLIEVDGEQGIVKKLTDDSTKS
jgi:phosphohistidine swiveling domain-containing protein